MQIFKKAADIMDIKPIRVSLISFGLLYSIFFVPMSLFTLVVGIPMILDLGASDYGKYNDYFFIGLGSIAGIITAWMRMLIKKETLQNSFLLRTIIFLGLLFGIIIGIILAARSNSEPMFLLYAVSIFLGLFLMVSTVGLNK